MEPALSTQYDQIYSAVAANFTIEESSVEFDTPTFRVASRPDNKQAFLRLYRELDSLSLVPILRRKAGALVLKITPKPLTSSNRPTTNVILLLITLATTLIAGYVYVLSEAMPDPFFGAVLFSVALLSILGAHEMAHKLVANRHNVEATYPYFIPGIPPLPTFGAVIQQKSLPPNRDALFDLGMSGPLIGFVVTVVATVIGVRLSIVVPVAPSGSGVFPTPLLFDLLAVLFPPSGHGSVLLMHPVAYAGFIGMVVTMLNVVPVGQLDGGHVAYVLLSDKWRRVLGVVALVALLFISVPMAFLAFFVSRVPHPSPLDDVSGLSQGRKFGVVALILIFVLTVVPVFSILQIFSL